MRARSALTIAGLDPSGGAGIAADLRAFRAAGLWGASACAVVTVQSTAGLVEACPIAARVLAAQVAEVLGDLDVRAMKAGALGSEENVRAVAAIFAEHRAIPSVVDPVMAASRQRSDVARERLPDARERLPDVARLDGSAPREAMWALLRAATLVTPNAVEASALLGRVVRSEAEGRAAAEDLVREGVRAALVKGGHLEGRERSVDYLATRSGVVEIARKRVAAPDVHGTGCTLSALIAGALGRRSSRKAATDAELVAAVRWARGALDRALRGAVTVGRGARVLDVRGGSRVAEEQAR